MFFLISSPVSKKSPRDLDGHPFIVIKKISASFIGTVAGLGFKSGWINDAAPAPL